jgi:hypothetical protein
MKVTPDPISVLKYDAVAKVLVEEPGLSHEEVARRCGVSRSTVQRIWEGSIHRPPVIVLERLPSPRRCPDCGGLCSDWPCVLCEMRRRNRISGSGDTPRFQYRTQTK